jgi:hypothetical protein
MSEFDAILARKATTVLLVGIAASMLLGSGSVASSSSSTASPGASRVISYRWASVSPPVGDPRYQRDERFVQSMMDVALSAYQ